MQTVIKNQKLYVQIADRLIQAITAGEFQVGDKLPQERILAAEFGVSRPTIREALVALEITGVVEIHPGSRSVVRHVMPQVFAWADKVGFSPKEVLDARAVCEEGIIRQVCHRTFDADFSALQENLRKTWEDHQRRDIDAYLDDSLNFHYILATTTGNSVLEHILHELTSVEEQPMFRMMNKLALMSSANRLEQFQDHKAILQAIEHQEEDAAIGHLRKHLVLLEMFMFDDEHAPQE
ncbi:MAG: GntR family transcriptional regulator [Firmicutes bacterium]|nr:GntR family transcriptional regulator [Bacillota bacterium]